MKLPVAPPVPATFRFTRADGETLEVSGAIWRLDDESFHFQLDGNVPSWCLVESGRKVEVTVNPS